jgi:hypothetical protein
MSADRVLDGGDGTSRSSPVPPSSTPLQPLKRYRPTFFGERRAVLQRRGRPVDSPAGSAHRWRRAGLLPRVGRHRDRNVYVNTSYPVIATARGGTINGIIARLNA